MSRLIIELFGAVIAVAGGFVLGYRKCKRDYKIKNK